MRVAIYARVSTEDQKVDLQLDALREYAKFRKWTIHHEFIDRGVSGALTSRPQLDALMEQARKRKFEVVAVWKFDRWGRNAAHLSASLDEFKALGIHFASYTENVDTSLPMGTLVFQIFSAVAQFERDLNLERTLAGIAARRARGEKFGRPKLNREAKVKRNFAKYGKIREAARRSKVSVGYAHSVLVSANLITPKVKTS